MDWGFLVAIVVLALLTLLALKRGSYQCYPYQLRPCVLTEAERSFYGVLTQLMDADSVLLAKVRVTDVLQPKRGMNRSEWQKAFNKISAKHFDFLLCAADNMQVKLVIELDDKSHNTKSGQLRDKLLNRACASAGLTIKRIKTQRAYRLDEVRKQLFGTPS